MVGLALVLSCLVILVQFDGILSEHDCVGNKISKIHRLQRSRECDQDHIRNSTNNTKIGKIDTEKYVTEVYNKRRDIPLKHNSLSQALKGNARVIKHEPIQADNKSVTIEKPAKLIRPKTVEHFFEDIDEDSPVHHIQVKEPRFKEEPVKTASTNKTSNDKALKGDKVTNIGKTMLPENKTMQSPKELIPQLRAAEPESEKPAVNVSSEFNGCKEKLGNTTNEKLKEESVVSVPKSPNAENRVRESQNQGPENDSVIEIKEHKYEEDIVRYCPPKSCQPNIKRHWEASQNFNPQFSKDVQAMNPYQGLRQDPYQSRGNTNNRDKCYSPYTCGNYMDQNNRNYFYANFDSDPSNQAKLRSFQGYGNCNRVRKTWLDRETKIRTDGVKRNPKGSVVGNYQNPCWNKNYRNVMKKSYDFNNNALSNNAYAGYNAYQ